MPAEQLRSARIVLLKVTHLPYVAAIWAYEGAGQYFDRENNGWQYTPRSQNGASHTNHTSLRISRYSALRTRSEASLLAKTPVSDVQRTNHENESESVVELEKIWCDGTRIFGRVKEAVKD